MIYLLRVLFALFLILLIIFVGFYFWACSPNYPVNEYKKLIKNNYVSKRSNDTIFSIVTYNIGYLSGMTNNLPVKVEESLFSINLNSVLVNFKKLNPDIIAFQEIDYESKRSYDVNQQNEIAKLGYNFVAQTINWDKKYLPFPEWPISAQYGRILSGQSILSKFKISHHKRIELERNPTNPFYYDAFYLDRLAQVTKIEIKNKTVVVINIHTEAFHQETRINQIKKIIKIYEEYRYKYPTVLLGDFNSDINYTQAAINLIIDLPKTGNVFFNKKDLKNTFDSDNPTERLDYIFFNTDFIEYVDGRILTEFKQASDHLPLLMKFKLKQ